MALFCCFFEEFTRRVEYVMSLCDIINSYTLEAKYKKCDTRDDVCENKSFDF